MNHSPVTTTVNHPNAIQAELANEIKDNLSYSDYVSMGKELIKRTELYQARIAFYACRVCQIRHGGKSDKYYTLSDYADDIGLNRKTLQQWTLTYRNVIERLEIPLDQITKEVWRAANRTNDNITWRSRNDNKEKGTPRRALKYKSQIPINELRSSYERDLNEEPSFETEIRVWGQTARQIKAKIVKRDLNLAHEGNLIDLMNSLDEISDHINNFLTSKRKKKH